MKFLTGIVLLITMSYFVNAQEAFKPQQLKFDRVKAAYELKWELLQKELQQVGIVGGFDMLLTAYKAEGKLEVWLKNPKHKAYTLFKTYDFCARSGTLGPKVTEGDLQTPEGFYKINVFNPMSSYHLSLGIDYPNKVDSARTGKGRNTGGDIYIHGDCVTVGCIPVTDDKIREIYVLAVEAKNSALKEIPVYIFPFRMTKSNLDNYAKQYPQHIAFWKTLQPGFDYFEQHKKTVKVEQISGKYAVK